MRKANKTWLTVVCVALTSKTRLAVAAPSPSPSATTAATPSAAAGAGIFFDASTTEAWAIKGKVVFKDAKGIFVKCRRSSEQGHRQPAEGEIIFLRDPFPDQATMKDFRIGSDVERLGFSVGDLQNTIGHDIPAKIRAFEIR